MNIALYMFVFIANCLLTDLEVNLMDERLVA